MNRRVVIALVIAIGLFGSYHAYLWGVWANYVTHNPNSHMLVTIDASEDGRPFCAEVYGTVPPTFLTWKGELRREPQLTWADVAIEGWTEPLPDGTIEPGQVICGFSAGVTYRWSYHGHLTRIHAFDDAGRFLPMGNYPYQPDRYDRPWT